MQLSQVLIFPLKLFDLMCTCRLNHSSYWNMLLVLQPLEQKGFACNSIKGLSPVIIYYIQRHSLYHDWINSVHQTEYTLFQIIIISIYLMRPVIVKTFFRQVVTMSSDYISGTHSMAFVTVPNEEVAKKLAQCVLFMLITEIFLLFLE